MARSITLFQRIRRTPYQALSSVFMIFLTLFVSAAFFLGVAFSSALLAYFETKPQLTVYFKDEKTKASIDELITRLEATGKVVSYEYISKEKALAIYQEQNKNDPLLLEMVTADILPSSLEISAISPAFLSELSDLVRGESGIDEIVYQKEVVETLVAWTTTLRKIGIFFIVLLLLTTLFILLTTIGMRIAHRKTEIEILTLVGATPGYIERPFILEGLLYGFVGATIAWVSSVGLLLYIQPFLTSFLQGIHELAFLQIVDWTLLIWPPTPFLFLFLWVLLSAAGLLIGGIGSLLAVARYMQK